MSHSTFSYTANHSTAQTGPAMRRDDNQVSALLCSSLMDCGGAVSGNSRCIDRNTTEIDPPQESSHLIPTATMRRVAISRRIIIAAARCHHNWAQISDVQDDNACTYLFGESNRVPQACEGTVREVDRNQNSTNKSLERAGARS